MKVALIQPCIGKRYGRKKYIGTWQMEPLTIATLAGLTPNDIDLTFFDDRIEPIDYDRQTDLVAISVETYTAKRAYQIASRFRRKGVPVVMGGFHATLCPEEVSQYAEAVLVGEAEGAWNELLADAGGNRLQPYYYSPNGCTSSPSLPDRSVFQDKKYLPLRLIEAGRGCTFGCEFCAVTRFFRRKRTSRSQESVFRELQLLKIKRNQTFFFVDDNISAEIEKSKVFLRELAHLKIKWVGQMSLDAARDSDFLELLRKSGCQGVLIGLESLNKENLKKMKKGVNLDGDGFSTALENLHRHAIRLYATFVFGYDADTEESFEEAVLFALHHRFFIAAFNHLTPFPGTPLYQRLEREQRLLYKRWWLDENYKYNMIPFLPHGMSSEKLRQGCLAARNLFYSPRSIWQRGLHRVNRRNLMMWLQFFGINLAIKKEVSQRDFFPLGDENDRAELIKVRKKPLVFPITRPNDG